MIVAIHQPNYVPWLGYFRKIVESDIFVFLDDAQFTKGGFTNRVKVAKGQETRWLSVPVSVKLGTPIKEVHPSDVGWKESHLNILENEYRRSKGFKEVWSTIKGIYGTIPEGGLSVTNVHLAKSFCKHLGVGTEFHLASDLKVPGNSDDRLIGIMKQLAPGGNYLSGKGAASYQDPGKFSAAGLGFRYLEFQHPVYDQRGNEFVPGLSVLDAVFNLGFAGTREILSASH